jgi:hypothetical protein
MWTTGLIFELHEWAAVAAAWLLLAAVLTISMYFARR